jgi:hypothetical protein
VLNFHQNTGSLYCLKWRAARFKFLSFPFGLRTDLFQQLELWKQLFAVNASVEDSLW